MRKKLIAANWKMNKTLPEAIELASELVKRIGNAKEVEVAIAPNFTVLYEVSKIIKNSVIKLAAQDIFWEEKGAYTGESSAKMIKEAGAEMVIIGHSERRKYFGDTDENINKKLKTALKEGLKPIFCVGEKLEEREQGKEKSVVEKQVKNGISGIEEDSIKNIVIAYEPVWAIGTGKTATPEQAQEMHLFIRELTKNFFNNNIANNLKILYGGSVTPENTVSLLTQPDIDGALVGGASLNPDSFESITKGGGK